MISAIKHVALTGAAKHEGWQGAMLLAEGRVSAYGMIGAAAPIAYDGPPVAVKASDLLAAVKAAGKCATLAPHDDGIVVEDAERGLRITIRAYLDVDDVPDVDVPPDDAVSVGALPLDDLLPFVATDNTRGTICGVVLRDGYVYATNSHVVIRTAIDYDGAPLSIPRTVCDAARRAGDGYSIRVTGDAAWFCWPDGRTLRSSVWRDAIVDVTRVYADHVADTEMPGAVKEAYRTVCATGCELVRLSADHVRSEEARIEAVMHHGHSIGSALLRSEYIMMALPHIERITTDANRLMWSGNGYQGIIMQVLG